MKIFIEPITNMLLGLQDSINKSSKNFHISFTPDYDQYACRKEPTEYMFFGLSNEYLRVSSDLSVETKEGYRWICNKLVYLSILQNNLRDYTQKYIACIEVKLRPFFQQVYDKEAEKFEDKLTKALKKNQYGFVKLFITNGVININKFLTANRLTELYEKVSLKSKTLPYRKV